MRRRRPHAAAALAAGALATTALASTPPEGFVETLLVDASAANGAASPTAIAWAPDTGGLYVLEKGSGSSNGATRVRLRDAATGAVSTALDLACVDSRGERGLLGVAFDPEFADPQAPQRFVYLYYTRAITASGACALTGSAVGSRNQVSRFDVARDGTLSGEAVILAGPSLTSATNHNGGTIRFGRDGTLYVSMGDNDTDAAASPLSRDLSDLRGKILRVARDGSIPADNPFVGQAGARGEIWAWGLRNPFRFAIDPADGTLYVADVGESTWEAVYRGIAGADYGYPCYEGSHPFRTCDPAPDPASVTPPIYEYGHGSQTPPVAGGSVTGGPVYRAGAFPLDYHGDYFFGDYVAGWVRRADVGADGTLQNVRLFLPDAARVVDLEITPAGCLAWVDIGTGVREVCWAGGGPDEDLDGDGFTPRQGDCDDGDPTTFPGALERCDGRDHDCNGVASDAVCAAYEFTGDGRVDGAELAWIGRAFGSCSADPGAQWWGPADYSRDGCVDGDDLALLGLAWACAGAAPVCPP